MRAVERRWVGLLDSNGWRRVARSRAGGRVLAGPLAGRAGDARRRVSASLAAASQPGRFTPVRTFCLFVGTVKSGGSLLGALLDAHPRIVLADEVDALRLVEAGCGRQALFHLLARGARREAMKGRVTARRLEPYSLAVPGSRQGVDAGAVVIGDSRAGPTTRRLGDDLGLLERLERLLGDVEARYVHVVRDPVDPIAVMVVRGRRTLTGAIRDYAEQSARVAGIRAVLGERRLLTVRYEDLVAAPRERLAAACRFLGVEAGEDYLAACASIVEASRPPERYAIRWNAEALRAVERLCARYPFLDGYARERDGAGGRP